MKRNRKGQSSRLSRNRRLPVFLSLILVLSLFALWLTGLAACDAGRISQPASIDPVAEPDAFQSAARQLAWSGNLHYQNFVIDGGGRLLLSAEAETIAFLEYGETATVPLIGQPGRSLAGAGNWLFFTAGELGTSLRKIKTDGTNSVRISSFAYQYLIADQDFLIGILTSTGQVMRLQHDGTDRQSLFDGFATELQYDGRFLYVCGADDKTGLIRIDPLSGLSTRLLDRRVVSLNKAGDWFYFADPADQQRVHAWSEQENLDRRVTDCSLTRPFIVYDGWLYYLDTENQNRLMRLPVADGCTEAKQGDLVVNDAVSSFVILPDAVYYRRPQGSRIYRVPLPSGEPVRIR